MNRWFRFAAAALFAAGIAWGCSSRDVELDAPESPEAAEQQQQINQQIMMAPPDYHQRGGTATDSGAEP